MERRLRDEAVMTIEVLAERGVPKRAIARKLGELFRGERLRVGPDPERGFCVEGSAWLSVAQKERGGRNPQDPERLSRQVAGAGFDRVPSSSTS